MAHGLRLFKRILPVERDGDLEAGAMQQFQCNLAIDRIVLGQQYAGAPVVALQQRLGAFLKLFDGRRNTVAALQRNNEPEAAAGPWVALRTNRAAHQFYQAAGDHQPQPGAAITARGRGVDLLEGVKQAPEFVRGDADPGIFDLEPGQQRIALVLKQFAAQCHLAVIGEFNGIAGVVEQCLAQTRNVTAQPHGQVAAVDLDAQPFALCRVGYQRLNMVEYAAERKIVVLQAKLSGFDFRKIENVVDDGHQVPAGLADFLEALDLLRRRPRVQQMGKAQYRIHRRADLVAHVGQKLGLGQIGGFGGILRQRQLSGSIGDQLLQVLAIVFQLGALLGDVVQVLVGAQSGVHRNENPVRCEFGFQAVAVDFVVGDDVALRRIAGLAGHQDDAHHAVAGLAAHMAHQFESGLCRLHDHVEQDQRNVGMGGKYLFGFLRRMGVEELQALAFHHHVLHGEAQHGMDVGLVVHHQHFPGRPGGCRRGLFRCRFRREQRREFVLVIGQAHRGTSM